MLLILIEKKYPLDEVVFFDTGMEFDAIYAMRDMVKEILPHYGITYTELYPENSFEWSMFDRPVNGRKNGFHYGYSWCGGRARWGTTEKLRSLNRYCGDNIVYVGIAHDERERIAKERETNKRFPLVEMGICEGEALVYCYERGYWWKEGGVHLYSILDRASCWCCSNKNIKELRNYYNYLPKYWEKLKDLQRRTSRPFKGKGLSVFDLERKFINEVTKNETKYTEGIPEPKPRDRQGNLI